MSDGILEAALQYAGRGWHVFPAPRGEKKSHKSSKHSGGRNWGMTKDAEEIERDWARWPDANIGIPTGAVNGFFVIEADTVAGHGVDGITNMNALAAAHGGWAVTLMAESPSGSLHRYYQHPGGDIKIKNSESELAEGVDVLGDGGMVIGPPSVHKRGGVYKWVNDLPLAEAPDWLIEKVKRQPRAPTDLPTDIDPDIDTLKLSHAMSLVPNDDSWEQWCNVGMALWRATGGSEDGRWLYDIWSQRSTKYDAVRTATRWDKLHGCPPTEITGASILRWADQASPGWRRKHEEIVARRRNEQIQRNIEIGNEILEDPLPIILSVNQMIERFVWIGVAGAVVDRISGKIRKKEQAVAEYAASHARINNRNVPCLKLWMVSAQRASVDVLAWVPGAAQICFPPEMMDGAQTAFNTWRGIRPMPVPNDWWDRSRPFVDHIEYLVPVEDERKRFMQWLGHLVQRPEELPHTAYLMVTPTTGIGRNWLASVLTRVLPGHVAAGVSLPELLEGGFNGRLSHKLLAIVDELREGPSSNRYQRANRLKSIITEEARLINPKYGVQSVEKNCCRWLMFSNHFDALPFDMSDRRIELIANPTEIRDAGYYQQLYRQLEDPAFIGSVRQCLMQVDLADFNPGDRATMNEAKRRAIDEMKTDLEQAVDDFKEQCETELVARQDIEAAVSHSGRQVNDNHLTHAIAAAGMINTGRRIKPVFRGAKNYRVVIVDTDKWTVAKVMAASASLLRKAMGKPVVNPDPNAAPEPEPEGDNIPF